ncbi:hypothetical protein BpHYR1_000229 [Brachionus plicatilis]|uniref:Uncharacterized protein n=1 Tax=Brachionus plicatilis TaxID=10195 RepID=A0A3M7PFJ8_BRAPC|nr:hypothetical protein BpHYR1_000229 [Brachionus plicatilis]
MKLLLINIFLLLNLDSKICIDSPRKVLWFLFDHPIDPQSEFYCPQKHTATHIEDLCYYFYLYKKMHQSAKEACEKVSHRLAEIDSAQTWQTLVQTMSKLFNKNKIKNLRFHMGLVNLKDKHLYWANTSSLVNEELMCQKIPGRSFYAIDHNSSCIELIHNDPHYQSLNGLDTCLKLIDCHHVRYAICEWRGDSIKSYNLELRSQLINSYISILVVICLFCFMWIILYNYHARRVNSIISKACADYLEEEKIFNLRTRD